MSAISRFGNGGVFVILLLAAVAMMSVTAGAAVEQSAEVPGPVQLGDESAGGADGGADLPALVPVRTAVTPSPAECLLKRPAADVLPGAAFHRFSRAPPLS
ncbi:MAG: hypothetical protein R6X15_03090 [Pseudomonadota bacterium]